MATYHPFQRKAVSVLLQKLLKSPEDFFAHVRNHAGAIILRVTYGITSQEDKDYYVELASNAVQSFIQGGNHGAFLIDFFPSLKYVPTWFPGATFKRKGKVWAQYTADLRDRPWEKLTTSLESGHNVPRCFVTDNIAKFSSEMAKMEEVIRNCAGVAYVAGSDTTVAMILSAILALVHHQDIQLRAQSELDSVVGKERLPDFSDRGRLPYVDAVFKEIIRFSPVVPNGVSHHSVDDDIYEGYFIPKGTTIISNIAGILYDGEIYPNPEKFNPDRFLEEGKEVPPDPASFAFGFGRRICPGRYIALDSAWLAIACLLATFNIKKALNAEGKEIEAVIDYVDGEISHPRPFQCRFVPRSPEALHLIQTGFEHNVEE